MYSANPTKFYGLTDKLISKYTNSRPNQKIVNEQNPESLKLIHLSIAFYMLVFGHIVSLIVHVLENVCYRTELFWQKE